MYKTKKKTKMFKLRLASLGGSPVNMHFRAKQEYLHTQSMTAFIFKTNITILEL